MYMPTGAIRMPSTKGSRQPQLSRSAGASTEITVLETSAPNITPRPWLATCQLAMKARSLRPAYSTSMAVDAPTSPPAEKPWISRASTMIAGAASPICAGVGAAAIMAQPSAMRPMVSPIAFLRPWRSA